MNKTELIERIIDTFTDMSSEDPEDTAVCSEISLEEATIYLGERRAFERADLEPCDWLPAEVTPELYMEAENCYIRKCRHDVQVKRLAEFLYYGENYDAYDLCRDTYGYSNDNDTLVLPMDLLAGDTDFPFTHEEISPLGLIAIGQNSPDFRADSWYCWYDPRNEQLHSTNKPFEDGLLDAKALAEFILADPKVKQEVIDTYMINTDIDYIFSEDM